MRSLFGSRYSDIIDRLGTIDPVGPNHWVWLPKSHTLNIASNVYHFLNSYKSSSSSWPGWRKLWHIKTALRVKYFLWLVFRGRLLTGDLLHAFNLGPRSLCALCGLVLEIAEHLLLLCSKAQLIWQHIGYMMGS